MSSRSNRRGRRRSPLSPAPGTDDAAPAEQQVAAADEHELVSRLRALLPPDQAAAAANGKAKASSTRARVLREACVYIRRLHAEVDAAAERLARLLEDDDDPSVAAAVVVDGADDDAADDEVTIRNLLM
ncbi:unnamed protein product [Miscanthus lutarioriparius]|uniref:BHLH domain-containing protein n=1 Tax=Miscanthus lutarioriparius TaxID=422564 RepID=A0A811Q7Q4_9POAL|nr:unnamed protein product [Miscanthus lutarioriparius]